MNIVWAAGLLGCCLWASSTRVAAGPAVPIAPAIEQRSAAPSSDDEGKEEARRRRARREAPVDPGAAQVIGRIPPSGPQQQPGSLKFSRAPFQVRQSEFSLGLDHALDERWSVGGWLGQSRGRLSTRQSVVRSVNVGIEEPQVTATALRTRGTSLTGLLSWVPRTDVFVDSLASWSTTRVELRKDAGDDGLLDGEGRTLARSWTLGAHVGRVWRTSAGQWVPQFGLEYAEVRVSAYDLHEFMTLNLDGSLGSTTRIGAQDVKIASSVAGLTWQRPAGASFGVWMPHLRLQWRERLWSAGDAGVPGPDEVAPPQGLAPRHAWTTGIGLTLLWPRGVSGFVDASYTRASEQLRERRLALGMKFEI